MELPALLRLVRSCYSRNMLPENADITDVRISAGGEWHKEGERLSSNIDKSTVSVYTAK